MTSFKKVLFAGQHKIERSDTQDKNKNTLDILFLSVIQFVSKFQKSQLSENWDSKTVTELNTNLRLKLSAWQLKQINKICTIQQEISINKNETGNGF